MENPEEQQAMGEGGTEEASAQGSGENVRAESVNITQGGAANVEAQNVTVTMGGIQRVDADEVDIRQGGVFYAKAETIDVTQGGVGLARGDEVTIMAGGAVGVLASDVLLDAGYAQWVLARNSANLQQGGAMLVASPTVNLTNSLVGVLLSRNVNGDVRVMFDRQAAVVFGIAAGVVMGLILSLRRR